MALLNFLRKNFVSLVFPIGAITLIALDLNHSRKWKEQQQLQK